MIKHTQGKIQVGNIVLDAEIELEEKPLPVDANLEAIKHLVEETIHYLGFWPASAEYGSSDIGNPPVNIVDGSLVEPIEDPTRLLEEASDGN